MCLSGVFLESAAWSHCTWTECDSVDDSKLFPACGTKVSGRNHCGFFSDEGCPGDYGSHHVFKRVSTRCWMSWKSPSGFLSQVEANAVPRAGLCQFCGRRCLQGAKVCAGCWLTQDAGMNPFEVPYKDFGWIEQAIQFAKEMNAIPEAGALMRQSVDLLRQCPHGHVVILFDGRVWNCCAIAQASLHCFAGLCKVIDTNNHFQVRELLQSDIELPPKLLCYAGCVSAILPCGVFITNCETQPKILLHELRYNMHVELPSFEDTARFEFEYCQPLQAIRSQLTGSRWWLDRRATAIISRALAREKICVVDHFLLDEEVQILINVANALYAAGDIERGNKQQAWFETDVHADPADVLNRMNVPRKWSMWDDNVVFCGDSDPRATCLHAVLLVAIDALVSQLKSPVASTVRNSDFGIVAERLKTADFREETMIACYLEATRGRYQRHIDSDGGEWRCLTAIFYLNQNWQIEDGGANRMYREGRHSCNVTADIYPIANRLLLFWANEDCPHEVLAVSRDRFAITTWYADGPSMLRAKFNTRLDLALSTMNQLPAKCELPKGAMELLHQFFPVRPLSVCDGLKNIGVDPDIAKRFSRVHEFVGKHRLESSRDKYEAMLHWIGKTGGVPGGAPDLQVALGPRECEACPFVGHEGQWGSGPYEGSWYCEHCWKLWA